MVKNIIILLVSILLWMHCNKAQDIQEIVFEDPSNKVPLKFELVKSTDIDNLAYPQLYVAGYEVGVYGHVIKEKRGEGIYRFDHDLNPKGHTFIPMGQGPGDAGGGTRLYPFKEKLLASDNTLRRITFYNKEFRFRKMMTIKKPLVPYYFFKDSEFCISVGSKLKNKKEYYTINITSFPSFDSKKIYELGPFHEPGRIIGKEPGYDFFYHYKNEWVYVINMATYQIMAFDLNGVLQKKVKVNTREIKIGTEEQKKYVKDFLGDWGVRNNYKFHEIVQSASLLVPFKYGFVVVRRPDWRTSGDDFCNGDMFDYDLSLMGKVKIPSFYRCYYIRGMLPSPHTSRYYNGHFYLVKETEENIRLEKWKVID